MWVSFVNRSCDQKRCQRVPVGAHEAHIPWDSHDISGSHIWRFFFGGNPCISTHYPSPFFWNLSTPSHLWEVETHQVGLLCWYLLQVSFGWMVCSFCRPFFAVSLVPPFLLRQDIAQEADLQWFPLRLSTASSIDQQRTTGENTAVPRFTSVQELMPRRCRGCFTLILWCLKIWGIIHWLS